MFWQLVMKLERLGCGKLGVSSIDVMNDCCAEFDKNMSGNFISLVRSAEVFRAVNLDIEKQDLVISLGSIFYRLLNCHIPNTT